MTVFTCYINTIVSHCIYLFIPSFGYFFRWFVCLFNRGAVLLTSFVVRSFARSFVRAFDYIQTVYSTGIIIFQTHIVAIAIGVAHKGAPSIGWHNKAKSKKHWKNSSCHSSKSIFRMQVHILCSGTICVNLPEWSKGFGLGPNVHLHAWVQTPQSTFIFLFLLLIYCIS